MVISPLRISLRSEAAAGTVRSGCSAAVRTSSPTLSAAKSAPSEPARIACGATATAGAWPFPTDAMSRSAQPAVVTAINASVPKSFRFILASLLLERDGSEFLHRGGLAGSEEPPTSHGRQQ